MPYCDKILEASEPFIDQIVKREDLKDFHKSFLTIGPADFKTVEKWIYTFY